MKKRYRILCALILPALVFCFVRHAAASGGYTVNYFTPEDILNAVSSYPIASSTPNAIDANDQIILPLLSPSNLYPIYKKMIGRELSLSSKKLLAEYLSGEPLIDTDLEVQNAITVWTNARKLATTTDVTINPYKEDDYTSYTNCLPDTFLLAAQTLKDRKNVYLSADLETWLERQDAVFAQCGDSTQYSYSDYFPDGNNPSIIPLNFIVSDSGMPQSFWQSIKNFFVWLFDVIFRHSQQKTLPPVPTLSRSNQLLAYDELYQQSAEAFYEEDINTAIAGFQQIASDPNNPWRMYAALALGRSYLRKALFNYDAAINNYSSTDYQTVSANAKTQEATDLATARQQFQNVLNNPQYALVHSSAQALIDFIDIRINPEKIFLTSDAILAGSPDPQTLLRTLDNFSAVWGSGLDLKDTIFSQGSDFSRWLYEWGGGTYADVPLILSTYSTTKSLPWLLLALKDVPANDGHVPQLLKDAAAVPQSSVAYWTIQYYRIKLMIAAGNTKDAQDALSKLPAAPSAVVSDFMEDLRMQSSTTLSGIFSYSERSVVYTDWDGDMGSDAPDSDSDQYPYIDNKAKYIFNDLLPLKSQLQLAEATGIFPPNSAENIRLVTFARAFLLNDMPDARAMATLVVQVSTSSPELTDFLAAGNAADQQFAGNLFLLHHPYLTTTITDETDMDSTVLFGSGSWQYCQSSDYVPNQGYDMSFATTTVISSADQAQAAVENTKIYNLNAPDYFSEAIRSYALANPSDPRIPEALHDVVDVGHYSYCKGDTSTEETREAFNMLHQNYPESPWTGQTPYYY